MEVYRSPDGEIAKYVHDDGSETAIKAVTEKNPHLGHDPISCSKYAVFVSSSVGCPVGCKFCYLTVKKCPHHPIDIFQIVYNVMAAIRAETDHNPALKEKFFKLSWMGMGDPAFVMDNIPFMSGMIMSKVMMNELAIGIDGVDISTSMPKWDDEWIEMCEDFNDHIEREYPKNPVNTEQLSRFRFFYSLISMDRRREEVIPHSIPVDIALENLEKLKGRGKVDVICHHVLFDGFNDFNVDLRQLVEYFSQSEIELRLLRFNECDGSSMKETLFFDRVVKYLEDKVNRLRYQVSVGNEIKAACGQFLLKKFENKRCFMK